MTHDAGTMTTAPRWTPGDDATLTRLRTEGQTAVQIGLVLGRTRRAVLGRGDVLRAAARAGTVEVAPPTPVPAAPPEPEHVPAPTPDETMDRRRHRAWTPEEDARLVSMRGQGLPNDEIAEALGRTTNSALQRVMKLRMEGDDISTRKRPSRWTPERVAEARSMRADGLTSSQIARRLGTDAATVGRALRSPEKTEDSPGEGVRVGRTVPDHNRTATAVDDARAALARAQARHREAMAMILEPMREAMLEAGLVGLPTGDDEDDPACRFVDHLRRRGVELRRVT